MDHDEPFVWPDDFERMVPALRRFAIAFCIKNYKLDHATAEDIAQDVTIQLWGLRKSKHFADWKPLYAYVAAMVRTNAIKKIRKVQRLPMVHPEDLSWLAASADTTGTELTLDECLELLEEPMQREVFRLRVGEDLGFDEIRKRLGVAIGTAFNLVGRARQILEEKLSGLIEQPRSDASQAER